MDLLNLSGDERLDLGDLTFATNEVPTGLVNELAGNFLVAPGATSIVTGFRPSGSGQGPVQVGDNGVPNVAFLGQRVGGVVTPGVFTAVGPATQQLSVSSLPANTYGIFVRFNRIPGQSQTRKFWAKASPGQEYSQLTSTRLVGTWEARIEVSSPSAEWTQVGQAVVTSAGSGQGNTVVVTDQRTLYFEGAASTGFAPAWGSAADRSSDRSVANVGNLQRQLSALRQCIIDIKGRGLATWYQPNISGMQIGSGFGLSDTPTANRLCVGDNSLSISLQTNVPNTGTVAQISFDGQNDYLAFYRSSGQLFRARAGKTLLYQSATGQTSVGSPLSVSPTAMLRVSPDSQASSYGIAVVSDLASVPATLGLISRQATRAVIEFGQVGYGVTFGAIQCRWDQNPSLLLAVNDTAYLQATIARNGTTPSVSLYGNVSTESAITVNQRPAANGGSVFAAGYVSAASPSPSQISVPPGCSVSISNTGRFVLTFSGVALPSQAVVVVTPVGLEVASVAVKQAGNQLTVTMRDNTGQFTNLVDFSIVVFWGAN